MAVQGAEIPLNQPNPHLEQLILIEKGTRDIQLTWAPSLTVASPPHTSQSFSMLACLVSRQTLRQRREKIAISRLYLEDKWPLLRSLYTFLWAPMRVPLFANM